MKPAITAAFALTGLSLFGYGAEQAVHLVQQDVADIEQTLRDYHSPQPFFASCDAPTVDAVKPVFGPRGEHGYGSESYPPARSSLAGLPHSHSVRTGRQTAEANTFPCGVN